MSSTEMPITESNIDENSLEKLGLSHLSHEELEAKLNKVEAQLNEAHNTIEENKAQALRHYADLENTRKRLEKDVQNARKYGLERFVTELLPVMDSLERGLTVEAGDNVLAKQTLDGIQMTCELFIAALKKLSVEQVNPLGQVFDPKLHQAISMQEDQGAVSNTVLQVLQKGYVLEDRLIRPALVVVAK